MYISKKDREMVKSKYGGKCAYTGKPLAEDWQVDHVEPVRRNWWMNNSAMLKENHNADNMLPTHKLINHYKHSMGLEEFRDFMMNFHIRISKLPKNPYAPASIRRKDYMLRLAGLFDITPDKPFTGKFWFETINNY